MKKKEVIQLINDYWKFDNDQDNLSTWHDKQDLISEIEKLTLTGVVGHSEQLSVAWKALEWVGFTKGEEFTDDDIQEMLNA